MILYTTRTTTRTTTTMDGSKCKKEPFIQYNNICFENATSDYFTINLFISIDKVHPYDTYLKLFTLKRDNFINKLTIFRLIA
jgi:hypothetical protein